MLDRGAKRAGCGESFSLSSQQPVPANEEKELLAHSGIRTLFYPMLNKCLAIPLLETWSDFLWARGQEEGRGARLIALLNEGVGQDYATWRVLPAPEEWQRVVQNGLASDVIVF